MPEQPQWSERTLDMPPQDPWAEQPTTPSVHPQQGQGQAHPPTRPFQPDLEMTQQEPSRRDESPAAPAPAPPPSPFSQGRAQVSPPRPSERHAAEHEPTGTGWPGAEAPAAHRGMSWRWSELRRGNEWSGAAALFMFVCWGIWTISEGGDLGTSAITLFVALAVSVGVFCLARVVGYFVLERGMGRERRTARGSHLVTALFLAGVGVAHLQMTGWVMTAWNWVAGTF